MKFASFANVENHLIIQSNFCLTKVEQMVGWSSTHFPELETQIICSKRICVEQILAETKLGEGSWASW
jgi:hypothetical protein